MHKCTDMNSYRPLYGYACMHTHTGRQECPESCLQICMHMCACTDIFAHTHTYRLHACTHRETYMHTHAHI